MSTTAEFAKVSVSLPSDLLRKARERAGSRGLSGYVAEALEHQLRTEALLGYLAEADAEHGPVPAKARRQVAEQWPSAR